MNPWESEAKYSDSSDDKDSLDSASTDQETDTVDRSINETKEDQTDIKPNIDLILKGSPGKRKDLVIIIPADDDYTPPGGADREGEDGGYSLDREFPGKRFRKQVTFKPVSPRVHFASSPKQEDDQVGLNYETETSTDTDEQLSGDYSNRSANQAKENETVNVSTYVGVTAASALMLAIVFLSTFAYIRKTIR